MDSKSHASKDEPPLGPIWNSSTSAKSKKSGAVDEMASAFTTMANTVATAFQPANQSTPTKDKSTPLKPSTMGISPGRRIDLQQKLFDQIDMLHQIFEKGALTADQYEKRRESLLAQLDSLK